MTIRDAIAAGSFYDNFLTGRKLEAGDADAVFADPQAHGARVFEGETVCGGQEHFYLEPQCSFVVPSALAAPLNCGCSLFVRPPRRKHAPPLIAARA